MTDIITKLHDRIKDECTEVDVHDAYDEFLDEVYSFESIGGIFATMLPSNVLEKCDPVAYRCGFSDWLDGEGLVDIGVGCDAYFRISDMEKVRDNMVSELKDELSQLEDEQQEIEEDDAEAFDAEYERIQFAIDATQEEIDQLQKHVF